MNGLADARALVERLLMDSVDYAPGERIVATADLTELVRLLGDSGYTPPPDLDEKWHLTDTGLDNIEALIPKVPQDFEMSCNAYPKTLQLTLKFDRDRDVMSRAASADALCEAAMCLELLVRNLRAERARATA